MVRLGVRAADLALAQHVGLSHHEEDLHWRGLRVRRLRGLHRVVRAFRLRQRFHRGRQQAGDAGGSGGEAERHRASEAELLRLAAAQRPLIGRRGRMAPWPRERRRQHGPGRRSLTLERVLLPSRCLKPPPVQCAPLPSRLADGRLRRPSLPKG